MKTYTNSDYGFILHIPESWSIPVNGEQITPHGISIEFRCDAQEAFNIQLGPEISTSSLEKTSQEITIYAQKSNYSNLTVGIIRICNIDHVWASYNIAKNIWSKKYLLVLDGIEYAITATSSDEHLHVKQSVKWDNIVTSFQLLPSTNARSQLVEMAYFLEAQKFFERGNQEFLAGQYHKALEQFEQGTRIAPNIPGNFLGISMTLMQMVERHIIPKDQTRMYLDRAIYYMQECVRLAPGEKDYWYILEQIKQAQKRHEERR
jgi:tetratricopeptide (TPR) repeat protein